MADIDSFVRAEADSLVAELSAWCAIPSISTQPEHDADVRRSAEHLAGLLEAAGLHAEVLAVEGSQPEDRIHAPNERLLLANYYRGVRAAAYTFEELARPEVAAALRTWRG